MGIFSSATTDQSLHPNPTLTFPPFPHPYKIITPQTYDGDTPFPERQRIRERAHIILSNPDMLHQSVCPQHKQWEGFLSALR